MQLKRLIAILMVILTVVCSGMTAIAAGVGMGSESSVMNEGGEGTWVQADNGKWWYRYSDGTYPSSCWLDQTCQVLKTRNGYTDNWNRNFVICGNDSLRLG